MGGGHLRVQHRLDLDLLAERRPQQFGDIRDRRVDVDVARMQRLAPGKGKQMLDQFMPKSQVIIARKPVNADAASRRTA